MKHFFITLLVFVGMSSTAQNTSIGSNEKLVFSASYNMSGLLTEIAQVTMETSEVKTSKSTLLRLKCSAATYSKWDSFFKIRDLYESYVSPTTLTPYLYKRDINEGSYYKFMQYTYSHKNSSVKSITRKINREGNKYDKNETVKIGGSTKDIVATIYNLRNLDFEKIPVGSTKTFKVLFDNIEETIVIKYYGKEMMGSAIGKKECYKLSLSLNSSDVLKGGSGDNMLWLSADGNKIPVYAKFKIPVGNGELKIKSATGLKN
ncbi:MAG: DUF3108 domain-containing protein [Gelidibacter sp.]